MASPQSTTMPTAVTTRNQKGYTGRPAICPMAFSSKSPTPTHRARWLPVRIPHAVPNCAIAMSSVRNPQVRRLPNRYCGVAPKEFERAIKAKLATRLKHAANATNPAAKAIRRLVLAVRTSRSATTSAPAGRTGSRRASSAGLASSSTLADNPRHAALQVAEPAGFFLGHGHGDRVLGEVGDRVAEVVEQQGGHVAGDAEGDQDALDRDVGGGPGQGVGGHLPPAGAQPVGQVEQRVPGVLALADPPGDRRDPGVRVAVAQQLERAQLDDLGGEVLADVVGGHVNLAIPVEPQAQEVVVRGDDLPGRAGEIDLEHRHVAAQVIDVEDQVLGQLSDIAEDDPPGAERSQAEL